MATKQLAGQEIIDLKQVVNGSRLVFGAVEGDLYFANISSKSKTEVERWTIREAGGELTVVATATDMELTVLTIDAANLRRGEIVAAWDATEKLGNLLIKSIGDDVAGDTIIKVDYAGRGLNVGGSDVAIFDTGDITQIITETDDLLTDGQIQPAESDYFRYLLVKGTGKIVITPENKGLQGKK